jgi:hypothetical protein
MNEGFLFQSHKFLCNISFPELPAADGIHIETMDQRIISYFIQGFEPLANE